VENNNIEELMLYPNPSTSLIHINYEGKIEKGQLYSLDGKMVLEIELNDKTIPVQPSGVYFLRIGSDSKRLVFQ